MALADAAAGMNSAVQQILLQKLEAQRYADQQKQIAFENARQTSGDERANRAQDEQIKIRQLMEQDRVAKEAQAQTDKEVGFGTQIAERDPAGTFYPEKTPAVGYLRAAGVPVTNVPGRQAMGPAFTGPMPGDAGGEETPQEAQAGRSPGIIKGATAKQLTTADTADRKDWQAGIQQQLADIKTAAGPKEPTSSFQLQPEIDPKTGQQTGRFLGYNTKTNTWAPVQGQGPQATKAAPGIASAAEKDKNLGNARTTLDRLDADINAAAGKGLIGPTSGRISELEQMIGNNDPAISTLATRMVAAKMLVDAGIGGMRGAASPGLMARWDKLMGMQATPENLHNVAQVMREMVGGQPVTAAAGGTVSMVAPDGRPLMVPADKVAEMESHGAKRK